MSIVLWIVIGLVVLAACFGSGGKKTVGHGPKRIDHPHVIDDDDYECSVCRRRFAEDVMICPYCGTRFIGRVEDDEEFDEEEDELESWDEEDGL